METCGVIPLERDGPDGIGLSKLDLSSDDFQSSLPEQYWHVYHENMSANLIVGVWTTTSMQEKFGPYPGDEFMCILQGQVEMIDREGEKTLIKEGQTFCVRNGTPISWKQNGFLRKFFITYSPKEEVGAGKSSDEQGLFILNKDELGAKLQKLETQFPFEIDGASPRQKNTTLFVNDTGNMQVGMWQSTAFNSKMKAFPYNEFVQVLEGSVFVTEQAGTRHKFSTGDVFFVPKGTVCSWHFVGNVSKFYCRVDGD
ncbi:MAG: DUF861 domain-containing protein [Marinovum sp.]|jgi:hypothetical protein|nr:DUF861 domain-containing protein [Marinovum sp.]